MEHIYTVTTNAELQRYQDFVSNIRPALHTYIACLQAEFQVSMLPRTVVWTNEKIATQLISDIPIPAYTNDYRIVMTPDLDAWRNIYLKQIDGLSGDTVNEIRGYYKHSLNRHHILQILGHELAHHSELFIDEAYDSGKGIWFEEGMAEYISRRYFLTEEEFQQEARINRQLVNLYREHFGHRPLETFGTSTYQNGIADIFYEYWRSFLAVAQVVDRFQGDVQAVFRSYHQWHDAHNEESLEHWFQVCL